MRRKLRTAAPWVAVAIAAALAALGRARAVEAAPPKDTGNARFVATAAPSRVAPGGSGVVTIVGTIKKAVHVYADKLKIKPKAVDGVTYGKPEIKTKPAPFIDPNMPDDPPEQVWFDRVEIEIPFTLTESALPPLRIGADITWSCCDEGQCYAPETTKEPALADVDPPEGWVRPASAPTVGPESAPAPAPAAGEGPAALPADATAPAPPAGPVPGDPAPPAPPRPVGEPKPAERALGSAAARVLVRATASEITVTFTPTEGFHLYPPGDTGGDPIRVAGVEAEGHRWRDTVYDVVVGEIHGPFVAKLAYAVTEASKTDPVFTVHWQGCATSCETPVTKRLRLARVGDVLSIEDAHEGRPAPTPAPAVAPSAGVASAGGPAIDWARAGCATPGGIPATGKLFPEIGNVQRESAVEKWWRELGLFILLPVFGTGILLAFTPCVLPLIPITISIIGGNAGSMSRGRLTFLLGCYVAGLALAFGSLGLVASLTGGGMAAAFQSPVALWIIASVFVVLAFGMFGVYELQPPAWMQRLQGGAKGGSPIGAFLIGALGAVIASPCTGPVIAAMLVFTAQSGNVAARLPDVRRRSASGWARSSSRRARSTSSTKPGPWMVWVRYGFGIMHRRRRALLPRRRAQDLAPHAVHPRAARSRSPAAVLIQRHLIAQGGRGVAAPRRRRARRRRRRSRSRRCSSRCSRARPSTSALAWTPITSRAQLVRRGREGEAARARPSSSTSGPSGASLQGLRPRRSRPDAKLRDGVRASSRACASTSRRGPSLGGRRAGGARRSPTVSSPTSSS